MAFCSKCGAQLTEGAAFCGTCGASTAPGAAPSTPPPPPPPPPGSAGAFATSLGAPPNLVARIQNILTKPKEEWPVVEQEQASVGTLYTTYIMILAALPALANFIQGSIIGTPLPFVGWVRTPLFMGLVVMVVSYALGLAGVYLSAFIIDKLAPSFQSQPGLLQALKLVAYASTAAWVAGIANIVPYIGWLVALAGGIYAIYLFYLGLPIMMKTPQDKVIVYMIIAALVIIVIYVIIAMISGGIAATALVTHRLTSGY